MFGYFYSPRNRNIITLPGPALLVFLLLFVLIGCGGSEIGDSAGSAPSGSLTLSWTSPTTNEDGTQLTDLAGYRVYYGNLSGNYTEMVNVANMTTVSLGSLPVGQPVYIAVTAYDTSGNESSFSNEVSTIIN